MFSFAARSFSFQLTYFFANLRNFCPDFFASLPPSPERRRHQSGSAQLGSAVEKFLS